MPPFLAVLFWIWVVVSIVILLRRRITRGVEQEIAADEVTDDELTEPEEVAVEEPVPAMATAPAPAPVAPAPVPVVERPAPRSAPAAGIADALVGIQMPCDLVPLVVDRLATDKIALSTIGYPAEIVGAKLADEIERLGYVVRPLSDREVVATRGATELRLTIDRPGPDGRHFAHPQARDDSVVVEIVLS